MKTIYIKLKRKQVKMYKSISKTEGKSYEVIKGDMIKKAEKFRMWNRAK